MVMTRYFCLLSSAYDKDGEKFAIICFFDETLLCFMGAL